MPAGERAELLQEADVPEPMRARFLANIDGESLRLQRLVDRLLSLAGVEKRQQLEQTETVDLAAIAAIELEAKRPLAAILRYLTLLVDEIITAFPSGTVPPVETSSKPRCRAAYTS